MNLGCYLDSDLQPPPPGCCDGGPGPSLGDAQVGGGGVGALVNGTVKPVMTSEKNDVTKDFFRFFSSTLEHWCQPLSLGMSVHLENVL